MANFTVWSIIFVDSWCLLCRKSAIVQVWLGFSLLVHVYFLHKLAFKDITSYLCHKKLWNETTTLSCTSPLCHYFSDFLRSQFFVEHFLCYSFNTSHIFPTGPFISQFEPQGFYICVIECFFLNK